MTAVHWLVDGHATTDPPLWGRYGGSGRGRIERHLVLDTADGSALSRRWACNPGCGETDPEDGRGARRVRVKRDLPAGTVDRGALADRWTRNNGEAGAAVDQHRSRGPGEDGSYVTSCPRPQPGQARPGRPDRTSPAAPECRRSCTGSSSTSRQPRSGGRCRSWPEQACPARSGQNVTSCPCAAPHGDALRRRRTRDPGRNANEAIIVAGLCIAAEV